MPAYRHLAYYTAWFLVVISAVAAEPISRLPEALDGKRVDPFRQSDVKTQVFVFVSVDCPISNRYAPELKRLHEKFSSGGVQFWWVHADPKVTVEAARAHAREYQLPENVLLDRQHYLVERCKVSVTPEAAVFDADRRLRYHGRIDDLYVAFGKARRAPTRRDLEETLAALAAGRPIPAEHQRAIGCYIPERP